MRIFLLITDVISIILTIILSIDVIRHLKKSENKPVEEISKYLDIRIKVLQFLIILLTIINITLTVMNLIK